jgi:membrane glycosyltransferase
MGRWQLMQAILLFAGAPLYLLFLLAAAVAAATDHASPFPASAVMALVLAWAGALYAPKLLGYAEVALSPEKRARYGGLARFGIGVVMEFGFTLLLDAVSTVAKTGAMLRLSGAGWTPQNRDDRGVGWGEAVRLLWVQTVLGVAVFAGFAIGGWATVLWAAPLAGGLLLAIPLCVLTAQPDAGRWLRTWQIAAIPEEFGRRAARPVAAPVPTLVLQPRSEPD